MINEDNSKSTDIWNDIKNCRHQLYYVSPEMALSNRFQSLWQEPSFPEQAQALSVDEAHCIALWGDDFGPEYSKLSSLRCYAQRKVPTLTYTATEDAKTFEKIWTSLEFCVRPFWRMDVGAERANLTYIIRPSKKEKNTVLNTLCLLPSPIPDNPDTPPTDGPYWLSVGLNVRNNPACY